MSDLMGAVAVATAALPRLYPVGKVPQNPEYPYGIYSAMFGRGDGYTLDSASNMRWVRVVIQAFGRYDAAGAIAVMDDAVDALLDQQLLVDGWALTPLRMELDPTTPDSDDEDVISTTATLTGVATKSTPEPEPEEP